MMDKKLFEDLTINSFLSIKFFDTLIISTSICKTVYILQYAIHT